MKIIRKSKNGPFGRVSVRRLLVRKKIKLEAVRNDLKEKGALNRRWENPRRMRQVDDFWEVARMYCFTRLIGKWLERTRL